jgi:hypothetical protein
VALFLKKNLVRGCPPTAQEKWDWLYKQVKNRNTFVNSSKILDIFSKNTQKIGQGAQRLVKNDCKKRSQKM